MRHHAVKAKMIALEEHMEKVVRERDHASTLLQDSQRGLLW